MGRTGRWRVARGLDVLVVVAAVASALGSALGREPGQPRGLTRWLEAPAVAGVVLVLLLRHRFPLAAPVVMWLAAAALSFVDGRLIVGHAGITVAGLMATALLGSLPDRRRGVVGLLVVLGAAAVIVSQNPARGPGDYAFIPAMFAVAWFVGLLMRERVQEVQEAQAQVTRAEQDREAAARVAVAEERARIARELHDVVAHAVSVMVLQTGAVRHRMPPDRAEDREALLSVEQAGRSALVEMRRLLDAMRREGDDVALAPHPRLDELDLLVGEVRAAGLDVDVAVEGEARPLPPSLDLTAYRIVQEGLTNCLKHARARRAQVTVRYGDGEVGLEVRDDGVGAVPRERAGYGLVGVSERVRIFGGEMAAGPAPGGGFLLRARLPLDGRSATAGRSLEDGDRR